VATLTSPQHDQHVHDLRRLQKEVERLRRARYRREQDHGDGRPRVNHKGEDTLLELLKEGKR